MKLLGLLAIMLALNFNLFASHVVGGNIEVTQVSGNGFSITLSVFRDCNGSVDPDGDITIYEQGTNNLISSPTLPSAHTPYEVVLGDSCYTPTGLCVEQWTFTGAVTLPNNANGYYVVWGTCCRNAGIDNLASPSTEGSLFYTEFPDPALAMMNSTPVFGPFPANGYFCVDYSLDIESSVVDPDGDSLVYTLVTPYNDDSFTQPFNNVAWGTGYSNANIIGNTINPPMSIDSETGTITVFPEVSGVFVFSVLVEEYRNGAKIGETVRDVQYEALGCVLDSPPVINMSDTVVVFIGDSICVDMTVSDVDGTDTIYVTPTSVDFDLPGTYVVPTQSGSDYIYTNFNNTGVDGTMSHYSYDGTAYEGVGEILLRYCWDPGCGDIDTTYHIDLLAYSLGCSGSDTSQKGVVFSIQYATTPISINIPDSISVTYDEQICFELLTNDVDETGYPMSFEPVGEGFDYAGSYISPSQNGQGYYYSDFQGLDTLYLEDYSYSGNTVSGKDSLAIRYCWTPECGDVVMKNYSLTYKATVQGPCYDVSETKSMQVQVDPPVGAVNQIPNVFTPNGDSENDYFKLAGIPDPCFDVMEVQIFNRWGKKVFESNDPLFEWNGTNKNDGGKCAAGTYFVLIKGSYGSVYDAATGERIPNPVDEQYTIQLLR